MSRDVLGMLFAQGVEINNEAKFAAGETNAI